MTERLLDKRWFQIAVAAVFLTVAIISTVNIWTTTNYIRDTQRRDTAQEQCITDQAVWLQDWLRWRWIEHAGATVDEIHVYMIQHPQPGCHIRN